MNTLDFLEGGLEKVYSYRKYLIYVIYFSTFYYETTNLGSLLEKKHGESKKVLYEIFEENIND